MKLYAQWTEAEVVEYLWHHVRRCFPACYAEALPVVIESMVDQWFRAAWEWVENQSAPGIPCAIDPDEGNWGVRDLNSDDPCEPHWLAQNLPTSVHALGAACLLVAGKPVPA